MKILLAHLLLILGITKVYAGTSTTIKELAPVEKETVDGSGTHEGCDGGSAVCR